MHARCHICGEPALERDGPEVCSKCAEGLDFQPLTLALFVRRASLGAPHSGFRERAVRHRWHFQHDPVKRGRGPKVDIGNVVGGMVLIASGTGWGWFAQLLLSHPNSPELGPLLLLSLVAVLSFVIGTFLLCEQARRLVRRSTSPRPAHISVDADGLRSANGRRWSRGELRGVSRKAQGDRYALRVRVAAGGEETLMEGLTAEEADIVAARISEELELRRSSS